MTARLARLMICLSGQACTPVIYELAVETESETMATTHPGGSTGMPTDPTLPDPTEHPGETNHLPDCSDGAQNGGETDVDCGGPCKPCSPGERCEEPNDCADGSCVDGRCAAVQCTGPKDCPPAPECMQPTCTPEGTCLADFVKDGAACDDGDLCTLTDTCTAGKCVPAATLDCSKYDGPCRAGLCNPQTGGCVVDWPFEGQDCKDDCFIFGECDSGECVGKQPPGPLLFTDFSVAGGWVAEPPWELGQAMASQCSFDKAEDPKQDHSPGADDILAGAAIGACLPADAFAEACLESPPVDTMFMPGELRLHYWNVLNTAGAPMQSRIDVFDGKDQKWSPIVVIDDFIAEPDWTEHDIDLTPFKGPELRVRFCQVSTGKTQPVGGWSIDDLSIGAPGCP